jgi:dimethylargininase
MLTAITRAVSPSIQECELTFIERQRVDVQKAIRQQAAYEECLTELGVRVFSPPAQAELPDAVINEDTAVVVDEVAVVATMGPVKRRNEIESLIATLSYFRPLKFLNGPATLEGGDVVRVGRTLYVGSSGRTNREGISQLRALLEPYDYDVRPVQVKGCLHLTTGCTYIGRNTLLVNPHWVDTTPLTDVDVIGVPGKEPWAANGLEVGGITNLSSSFPETRRLLEGRSFQVRVLNISELEKAEAGLSCMSLIFDSDKPTSDVMTYPAGKSPSTKDADERLGA